MRKISLAKINWRVYTILVATVLLALSLLLPDQISFGRDSLTLLGIIAILALWPSLKNAKIPYIMEIKRKRSR